MPNMEDQLKDTLALGYRAPKLSILEKKRKKMNKQGG